MSIFVTEVVDEWGSSYQLTGLGYGGLIAVMLVVLLAACFISGQKGGGRSFSTRQLAFSAMAMALAMVTSMIKVVDLPMGGSVTLLSMLFISLTGYWFGLRAGLMTAVAYGFLQLIVDPYIISLPQMLTDYIFAFGALGLSGIFSKARNGMVKGYIAGVLGRYFFAFLSGMIFFGSYAADYNMSAPVYSLVYNGSYIGLEAAATLVLISLPPVSRGLARVKEMAAGERRAEK
ncbi:MAG: energy-coupled thiamine transporter ThiT [Kineothrix sp.]